MSGLHLPTTLGPLARCAADDQGRYSMNGVQVRDPGDGTFCCVSTNGRYLLIARGITPGDGRGHLGCPPDRSIVVPTVAWNEAFRKVPQLLDQPRGSNKPKTVEVALEGTNVRLSSQERSFTCDQIDGRFPDWTQVLPKRGPAFTGTGNDESDDLSDCIAYSAIAAQSFQHVGSGEMPCVLVAPPRDPFDLSGMPMLGERRQLGAICDEQDMPERFGRADPYGEAPW